MSGFNCIHHLFGVANLGAGGGSYHFNFAVTRGREPFVARESPIQHKQVRKWGIWLEIVRIPSVRERNSMGVRCGPYVDHRVRAPSFGAR